MKKHLLIVLLSCLGISACATQSPPVPEPTPPTLQSAIEKRTDVAFNMSSFLPSNATEVTHLSLDFENDGLKEHVLLYTSKDNISADEQRTQMHLKVFVFQDNQWKIVKEDIGAIGQGLKYIDIPKIVDLGNDQRQELLVMTEGGVHNWRYYIVGKKGSEYADLEIPKGYLHAEKYIRPDEVLFLWSVTVDKDGVHEKYFTQCDEKPWGTSSIGLDETICRSFEVQNKYESGIFTPELVLEKIEN